jgi:hypothetical protein
VLQQSKPGPNYYWIEGILIVMVYATEHVLRYRQALTTIWNTHFWSYPVYPNNDEFAAFKKLKFALFTALVSDRLGSDFEEPLEIFGSCYHVVPKLLRGSDLFGSLLISDTIGATSTPVIWRPFSGPLSKSDIRMTILDFFDWESLGQGPSDLTYYRVRIEALDGHPDKIGHHGLINVLDVDVLWEPPGIVGLPFRLPQQAA